MLTPQAFWHANSLVRFFHRHLRDIDYLMAPTACLVCFISTVNGHIKKKGEKCGASSGHITNLKQYIFSFDIYGSFSPPWFWRAISLVCTLATSPHLICFMDLFLLYIILLLLLHSSVLNLTYKSEYIFFIIEECYFCCHGIRGIREYLHFLLNYQWAQ
jgi:hypothetical protein